jgi:hypothetical protein
VKLKVCVTQELFVKLFLGFFNTYYVFYRNATITHATQKSLDYFIIRFLSFYQLNATKVENIIQGYSHKMTSLTRQKCSPKYTLQSIHCVLVFKN